MPGFLHFARGRGSLRLQQWARGLRRVLAPHRLRRLVAPHSLRWLVAPLGARAQHPFDLRHKVDTSGLLYAPELPTGHAHDNHNEGYYGTAPSVFHALMPLWQETLPEVGLGIEDYSFIDLGCGKGRVVMLASDYPFRSVAGIELNPGLAGVARKNLRRWMRRPHACPQVRVETGDVIAAPLPEGPVVLYCFNAFEREIVRMLLERLEEVSRGRVHPIDLLYVHPDHADLVAKAPRMEFLADEKLGFSEEDAGADLFGACYDRCCVFRLPGGSGVSGAGG